MVPSITPTWQIHTHQGISQMPTLLLVRPPNLRLKRWLNRYVCSLKWSSNWEDSSRFILNQLRMSQHTYYHLSHKKTPIARRHLSYVEGYGQNEEEPPRHHSRSPTQERSHRPKVPVRSEHSHIVQTSHHGKERVHHFHRSMLDSFSSSGSHRERPRKKAKKNSRHHQPTHQYQMEGSTLSKRVLEVKVPKEYLSAKMNLDKYDGLTNPREYIQNVRGALS